MIKRDMYMNKVKKFIDKDLVKIFTGIRRCGKSVMLELVKEELLGRGIGKNQFITMNFEDINNEKYCDYKKLHSYISQKIKSVGQKVYLFFDEIQEVEGWEKAINSFRVEFDVDIYVTGSNAKLLSGEFATCLGGRFVTFTIYPFSLSEFMDLRGEKSLDAAWREYVNFGGMPFLAQVRYEEDACGQYLKDVFNSIILKDIVARNKIRDIDMLERIILYVMANIGKTFSANSIAKYFKNEGRTINSETVMNYLRVCEEAYLFYRVKREDLVGQKILSANEKFFIADHGIREAIYGKNQRNIELVLENLVYLELLRRGYKVTIGKVGEKEIDFVAHSTEGKQYYQVCYILNDDKTIQREFSPLEQISDNYPKFVISTDEFDRSRGGIRHLNIKVFLKIM